MTRSALAGKRLKQAKEGHTLGGITMSLFTPRISPTGWRTKSFRRYARDSLFLPIAISTRSWPGLSFVARTRNGLREVYGFALKPDAIFYLRVKIDDLVTRVLQSTGFDYWESGMDLHMGEDMYESFVRYQKWLLAEFDKMVENYGFQVVDASGTIEEVFEDLRSRVERAVAKNGHHS